MTRVQDEVKRPLQRWSLAGRRALVTGGTRGIGHAIVSELLELGADVFIVARDGAELAARISEWRSAESGGRIDGCQADVSIDADRVRIFEQLSAAFTGLDIL